MSQDLLTIVTALTLYAAVVLSPGPNFALVTRLAASGQRTAAFGATVGLAIGATLYAILSMTGLSLLISQIGWLVTAIQIVGGFYLIYLGLSSWLSSSASSPASAQNVRPLGISRGLKMGMMVELSNPKGIAFFLSFYAVAIPIDTALWAKIAVLIGGFLLEVSWYGLVTILLSSRPVRAVYERFALWIERVIGTVLAAFGVRLIAERL